MPDYDYFYARRRQGKREIRIQSQQTLERIKRLDADPATRKYAKLMRTGQYWTDAEIAYDRDPASLATCTHLQPVERAMRSAGLDVRVHFNAAIKAECRIDEFPAGLAIRPGTTSLLQ